MKSSEYFLNRADAGKKLAEKLVGFKKQRPLVLGLPRGGIVTAFEVAKKLHAPLGAVIVRKIRHPYQPEYALGALSESGNVVGEERIMMQSYTWLRFEIETAQKEIARRMVAYRDGESLSFTKGKKILLVDDGLATGWTMKAAIEELREQQVGSLVAATPIAPLSVAREIASISDEFVALHIPDDEDFLGSVGSYYKEFQQVDDEEVVKLLHTPTV